MQLKRPQPTVDSKRQTTILAAVEDQLKNITAGSVPSIAIDLVEVDHLETSSLETLDTLYGIASQKHVEIILTVNSPLLDIQIDTLRLHRKFGIQGIARDPNGFIGKEEGAIAPVKDQASWQKSYDQIAAIINEKDIQGATQYLRHVIAVEDKLYAANLVRPYRDIIPKILQQVPAKKTADVLDTMPCHLVLRVLFQDYTLLSDQYLSEIFALLSERTANLCIRAMTLGVDGPRRMASVLAQCDEASLQRLTQSLPIEMVARLLYATEIYPRAVEFAQKLSPEHLAKILQIADQDETVRYVLGLLNTSKLEEVLSFVGENDAKKIKKNNQNNEKNQRPNAQDWIQLEEIDWFKTATGSRITTAVETGRRIHIEEALDCNGQRKLVHIDLLQLDPKKWTLKALRTQAKPISIEKSEQLFSKKTDSGLPSEDAFRKSGLFRLREQLEKMDAIGGINGNFFFDHGHLEFSNILGIDCKKSPGLHFGDPIGWYVQNGLEHSHPIFNRCAVIINKSGELHIKRVKMTHVEVAGQAIHWHKENTVLSESEIGVWTALSGTQSPHTPNHTDVSIAASSILSVNKGGRSEIPITGFILSIPNNHPVISVIDIGDTVHVNNDFPKNLGVVREAVACGPQLVKEGKLAIDFAAEEFGQKDSPVMSFFLPRLFESYEAARSFIMVQKNGQIVLGVVSGRSFGLGNLEQPAGLTFGELAQLALDLDAEEAMGLDGGGSSSLIAHNGKELEILNVPTGGADVPRGSERFIANGLAIVARG